jgi:Fe-S oxidoreductase
MAKLKAEFMQHYHDVKGISLPAWLIAHIGRIHRINSPFPAIYNAVSSNKLISNLIKKTLGFAAQRSLPLLSSMSMERWLAKNMNLEKHGATDGKPKVYGFLDEFTNFLDVDKGIAAVRLLSALGYKIAFAPSAESGRTYISKGFLRKARKIADKNIHIYKQLLSENAFLVGIEPSAILSFRDEYPELASEAKRKDAAMISAFCLTLEEFIAAEFEAGRIHRESFTEDTLHIKLHGHCQQKAIASTQPTKIMLTIPSNYTVEEIKSGCCGMAGAFGYEKRHYELSQKIGELVLFPEVRKSGSDSVICAPGTSCRQQIFDGTGVKALHPAEILYDALLVKSD